MTAQLKSQKLMLKLLLMQEHQREKQSQSTTLLLINGIMFNCKLRTSTTK